MGVMIQLYKALIDKLKEQDFITIFLVVSLAIGANYFHTELRRIEAKADECNKEKFEILYDMNERVIQALDRNSAALENCK